MKCIRRFLPILLATSFLLILSSCSAPAGSSSGDSPADVVPIAPETGDVAPAGVTPFPGSSDLSLSAGVGPQGTVTLSWTEDDSGIYRIWRIDPYTAEREIASVLPSEGDGMMTWTDDAADPDFYRVYAVESFADENAMEAGDRIHDVRIRVRNGFVSDFGALSYYVANQPVTDTVINGLQFDSSGIYTSGNAELDEYVRQLLHEQVEDNLDPVEKLRVLYYWLLDRSEYAAVRFVTEYDDTGWEPEAALKLFQTGRGNCFSYAAGICMIARAVGLDAHCVIGSCFQATQWVDHAWVEVTVDGTTYFCDPEMEGVFSQKRDYGWDLFMKQYGEGPTDYEIWKIF